MKCPMCKGAGKVPRKSKHGKSFEVACQSCGGSGVPDVRKLKRKLLELREDLAEVIRCDDTRSMFSVNLLTADEAIGRAEATLEVPNG